MESPFLVPGLLPVLSPCHAAHSASTWYEKVSHVAFTPDSCSGLLPSHELPWPGLASLYRRVS